MSSSNFNKIVVIGDEETVILFELIGIEGKIVNNFHEFETTFYELIKNPIIGMLFISERILADRLDFYFDFKFNNSSPFIFLLPDIFQSKDIETDIISKKIQEHIGKAMR